ncbi:MAG: hypothetical protein K9K65_19060 [Desulfarculaceae bacterium]|nr:hypothetical protein [Desulfarculaceae bacterium]MCF8049555.1 hypothetical protein [Desulfarculaceae bacterium]MCF8099945.1 hypothetical protein [Desulfarculaceae bacterium]
MVDAPHALIEAKVIGPQLCIGHPADLLLESDRICAHATGQQSHHYHQTTQLHNNNIPTLAKPGIAEIEHNQFTDLPPINVPLVELDPLYLGSPKLIHL